MQGVLTLLKYEASIGMNTTCNVLSTSAFQTLGRGTLQKVQFFNF